MKEFDIITEKYVLDLTRTSVPQLKFNGKKYDLDLLNLYLKSLPTKSFMLNSLVIGSNLKNEGHLLLNTIVVAMNKDFKLEVIQGSDTAKSMLKIGQTMCNGVFVDEAILNKCLIDKQKEDRW